MDVFVELICGGGWELKLIFGRAFTLGKTEDNIYRSYEQSKKFVVKVKKM